MEESKCICQKCTKPIELDDKVMIQGNSYHKKCCECCLCNKVSTVLKAYHGQIYCPRCFDIHKLAVNQQHASGDEKCICAKCQEPILDPLNKTIIGTKCYHCKCCQCCVCNKIPILPKLYQGQIYCPDCLTLHIPSQKWKDLNGEIKCICDLCHEPILDASDMTNIANNCYHKKCCQCCVCNKVSTLPKLYHGKIYCPECLSLHLPSQKWKDINGDIKCICDMCQEPILDTTDMTVIANKCYHKKCCQCCICSKVPDLLRTYYCQIYCAECFNKHVLGQDEIWKENKCICQKCQEQITEPRDIIYIANKCYHKKCCQCCICNKFPEVLKVYQSQIYCPECLNKQVCGVHGQNCICQRCQKSIMDPLERLFIGNAFYHKKCCPCCMCKQVPLFPQIHQCQVFCPECLKQLICNQQSQLWRSFCQNSPAQFEMPRRFDHTFKNRCRNSKVPVVIVMNEPVSSRFGVPTGVWN